MSSVSIEKGTPDMRFAQVLAGGELGMALSAKFVVPKHVQKQGDDAAIAFVRDQLEKACKAVPELSFSVTIGEPDL